MTKQEQIKKMTELIGNEISRCICRECIECDYHDTVDHPTCLSVLTAEVLYNAGYRLKDEVRKETLQEVVDTIKKMKGDTNNDRN